MIKSFFISNRIFYFSYINQLNLFKMSKENETITGGLGIKEEYFDIAKDRVIKKLKDLDTISDALESVAEEV